MIQRVQTIYLFVVAALTFCLFCLPFVGVGVGNAYMMFNFNVTACHMSPAPPIQGLQATKLLPLAIVTLCAALFCLVTIFLFANRTRQMKFVRFGIVFQAVVLIGMVVFCHILQNAAGQMATITITPKFAFVIPAVNIILLILANRGIKADDDLVKSADRLR